MLKFKIQFKKSIQDCDIVESNSSLDLVLRVTRLKLKSNHYLWDSQGPGQGLSSEVCWSPEFCLEYSPWTGEVLCSATCQ